MVKSYKLISFSAVLLSFSFIIPTLAFADDDTIVDHVNITVPSSCNMAISTGSGDNIAHTASMDPGEYRAGIGKTTLRTICNDNDGFAIYAVGYSNDTYGNTEMITDFANPGQSGTSTGNIITGLAQSGTTSNWAMRIDKVTDTSQAYNPNNLTITNGFDGNGNVNTYHEVPSTHTKVANYVAATGSSVTDTTLGSKITSTYAVYVSGAQAPATYTGQVLYTLVHPNTAPAPPAPQTTEAGCIRYYANASDAVGTMGCQSVSASDTSKTLLASNFSRTGYGFAGWSDAYDYATNPNANFYGPQEYITFTAGQYTSPNQGLSLYAVWVPSAGLIQSWNGCSSLTKADQATNIFSQSITALTDQRDHETYAVAKLADGQCWMIENLRLESTNSDNSTGALAQGYGTSATYGNFSGLANAEAPWLYDYTGANSLYYSGTQEGTASIDIGTTDYPAYRMPRYNNYNHQSTSANRPQNPTANDATNSTTNAGMYSYGNYYTWAAAIANTIYYDSPTATDADSKTSETVNTSLCPIGWRLPYGRNSGNGITAGGFSNLDSALGGTGANSSSSTTPTGAVMSKAWRSYPNNFVYSGLVYGVGNLVEDRGSDGSYWSSTAGNFGSAYSLNFYEDKVRPGMRLDSKNYGMAIRCVSI